uniref:Uncharacterized protein n=1 Tax=Lactuca sativa TaxID=4236 RepID=A0A9R1WAI5_LACSA|nr:hypothetical protein LSAT_V11C200062390 [Lactuca sativa]
MYNGGGINRMKQHLAGVTCAISACLSCPGDIKFVIKSSLDDNAKKKRNVPVCLVILRSTHPTINSTKDGKRKAPPTSQTQTVPPFFKGGMHDPSQPSIKATLQSKERWHDTDLALAICREFSPFPNRNEQSR